MLPLCSSCGHGCRAAIFQTRRGSRQGGRDVLGRCGGFRPHSARARCGLDEMRPRPRGVGRGWHVAAGMLLGVGASLLDLGMHACRCSSWVHWWHALASAGAALRQAEICRVRAAACLAMHRAARRPLALPPPASCRCDARLFIIDPPIWRAVEDSPAARKLAAGEASSAMEYV